MNNIRVIAGFPGIGKSSFYGKHPTTVTDSDSSRFPKSEFPSNYLRHIRHVLDDTTKTVLVSSHKEVRDALIANGIPFLLVYPKPELKDEYIKRYQDRGSSQAFIDLLSKNFGLWVAECRAIESDLVVRAELDSGEFLSDVVEWD